MAAHLVVCVYAFRGEADKTLDWLEKAVEYGDAGEIVTAVSVNHRFR